MHLATSALIVRLLLAAVLGALVGIERESASRGKVRGPARARGRQKRLTPRDPV